MKNKNTILIKNIYYMLSYAFRTLNQSNYETVKVEEFENIHDLFAAILSKGVSQLLKQGLTREYTSLCETLPLLRGKLNMWGTIRNKLQKKQLLTCEYDELSVNNVYNQIVKCTALLLLSQKTVDSKRKKALKKNLLFFHSVDSIDPSCIHWNRIQFTKNSLRYKMLLHICYFVLHGLLLSTEKGNYLLSTFLNDQSMATLFEKFVLEFYRYHHPSLQASASKISWNTDDDASVFLPSMQTDITLTNEEATLIIDTKYYSSTLQNRQDYDSMKFHSNNMYQIYAYVKNKDVNHTGKVSGMLLYAKTDEEITPSDTLQVDGNRFFVRTLDLNTDFSKLSAQLDAIVEDWLREE